MTTENAQTQVRTNAQAQAEAQAAVAALPLVPPDVWQKVRPTVGVVVGPDGQAVKQLTGSKLGSRAGATDEILLAIVGYRVSKVSLKTLADTAGRYNPLHTSERVKGVEQGGSSVIGKQGGHTVFGVAPDGTIAINPLWYAWRTGNTPAPAPDKSAGEAASAAMVAELAGRPTPAPAPERAGKGLGKAAKKSRKAVESEASPADLAAGKGLVASAIALATGKAKPPKS